MNNGWVKLHRNKLRRIVKSKPKKGYLYLLQDSDGDMKYGATTQPINRRLTQINSKTGKDFKVLFVAPSNDVFNAELYLKWELLNRVDLIGKSVEYFKLRDGDWHIQEIKSHMEMVCMVS